MAQTLPNGVVVPNEDGGEQISATGVAEMRTLGASADAAIADARFTRGRLQTGGDAFTLAPGVYTVGSLNDASQITNLPEQFPGTLIVEGNPGQGVRALRFIPYQRDYSWETTAQDLSNGFMPWRKSGATLSPYAQHAVRQSQMMYDVGPVDTGGLGAVSWRIDHGLTNFRDVMLPIFRAAGIVPMITLNSRDWGRAENTGVTQSEVNGWVANGWVEISNHGATHSNATGQIGIHDFVVNGLAELEAQLPAAKGKVYGFCIPGVGVTDAFDGFAGGNSPAQWDTYAGRLILQHHAVGYGHLAGTNPRILDGTPRDGLLHMATDTRTVADMTAAIDDAITRRRGLQIMSHPSNLNAAGYHSTAMIQQIVDHIVTKRDAGELAVLSPYQMMVADSTNPPPAVSDVTGLAARLAVLEYDSGWRDVSAGLQNGATGTLHIRRVGSRVAWRIKNYAAGTGHDFYTPPAGFRVRSDANNYSAATGSVQGGFYRHQDGRLCRSIYDPPVLQGFWWEGGYELDPGTAVPSNPPGDPV